MQALVEGGATLHGALLAAGLADRVVAYVAATALGSRARPAFDFAGPASIDDAPRWRLGSVTQLGDDVRLDYDAQLDDGTPDTGTGVP